MRVTIYQQEGYERARAISEAMLQGLRRCGETPTVMDLAAGRGVTGDCAVFYGFRDPLPRLMQEYRAAGRFAVHIDLGYWGRTDGGRNAGYHKFAVNARHPTEYFQSRKHPADRVARFGLEVQPWKTGGHILVCGMSAKHARTEGLAHQEWEKNVICRLQEVTDRPILYRPKPGDNGAAPIPGSTMASGAVIGKYLQDCHAVVSHHSNAAVDAALAGIPSFSVCGVGTAIGLTDFDQIENPIYPDDREQWLADIAYCQFNLDEMANGTAWRHLKDDGIIA